MIQDQRLFRTSKQIVFMFFVLTLVTSGSTYAFVTGDPDPNFNSVFATSSGSDGGGGDDGSGSDSNKKSKSSSNEGGGGGQEGGGGDGGQTTQEGSNDGVTSNTPTPPPPTEETTSPPTLTQQTTCPDGSTPDPANGNCSTPEGSPPATTLNPNIPLQPGELPIECRGIIAGPQDQCSLATPPATTPANTPPLQPQSSDQQGQQLQSLTTNNPTATGKSKPNFDAAKTMSPTLDVLSENKPILGKDVVKSKLPDVVDFGTTSPPPGSATPPNIPSQPPSDSGPETAPPVQPQEPTPQPAGNGPSPEPTQQIPPENSPPDPKDISSEKQAERERSSEEIGSGEICNNGKDDDGDGKVDFADSDCSGIKSAPRGTVLSQSPKDSKGFIRGSGAGGAPIDPGTATEPGRPYSDEDESGEKCGVVLGFGCLEPLAENPGMPNFSNDEICNNGKDDDGDGKVDEVPYCFDRNRQAYGPAPAKDTTLTPTPSQGPSPFGP